MIFNKKIDDNIDFNDTLLRDADTEKNHFSINLKSQQQAID